MHEPARSTQTRIRVAATMHHGRINPTQEDSMWLAGTVAQHLDMSPHEITATDDCLLAIADGVASSPQPARASRIAVTALGNGMTDHPEWSPDGLVATRHVRAAQAALCDALARHQLAWGACTTLVAAHLKGNRLAVVNSGDSRAYLVRTDGTVSRLSKDHTILQHLVDSGEADADIEYASIYYALNDCLVADHEFVDFAVHRETTTLHPGDRLILCSDGVHDVVDERRWFAMLTKESDPLEIVEMTRQTVLENGAPDNFSIIALCFQAT